MYVCKNKKQLSNVAENRPEDLSKEIALSIASGQILTRLDINLRHFRCVQNLFVDLKLCDTALQQSVRTPSASP
jgi:hypothetical protein